MEKYTFKDIENKGLLLLYKYIRGSHSYGLEKPDGTSDIDEGGVFIEPEEWLLGLGKDNQELVADERNDTTWYSLKKYMNMLLSSNPTVLESLFVDDKFVLYEHPIFTMIKQYRDKFLTKQAFKPLLGYSIEQIKKCRGNIEELNEELKISQLFNMVDFIISFYRLHDDDKMVLYYTLNQWFLKHQKPIGYKGMVGADGNSNELRLSSIKKDETPICYISYNKDGYSQHCRMYKEYQDWVKHRNTERFKENKDKEFDRKNVAHAVRLMHMGIELAKDGKFNVNRTDIDRDFILKIRLGKTTYDEIISYLEDKKEEMKNVMEESTLPDEIDIAFVNKLLIKIREEYKKYEK